MSRGHLPPVGQRCLPAVLWVYTCGAIASTAGVGLSIPPVAPADVPAIFHPRVRDIYLRWGRDVYLRCFWCLPPVVSPTLGGSKFVYTSGGSCGCACIVPPIDRDIYLRCKKIYHIEPDTARSPIVSARRKGAKVTQSPQRYTEQIETDRRA